MKKDYSKPVLDTKAFAQFENVFTACSKGHEGEIWEGQLCTPGYPDPPRGRNLAAYGSYGSV